MLLYIWSYVILWVWGGVWRRDDLAKTRVAASRLPWPSCWLHSRSSSPRESTGRRRSPSCPRASMTFRIRNRHAQKPFQARLSMLVNYRSCSLSPALLERKALRHKHVDSTRYGAACVQVRASHHLVLDLPGTASWGRAQRRSSHRAGGCPDRRW